MAQRDKFKFGGHLKKWRLSISFLIAFRQGKPEAILADFKPFARQVLSLQYYRSEEKGATSIDPVRVKGMQKRGLSKIFALFVIL